MTFALFALALPSSSPAFLQFPRHELCLGDVAALAGLVAAAKQDIDGSTMTHEIDAESRTMVDTRFRDAFAYRLAVPKLPKEACDSR